MSANEKTLALRQKLAKEYVNRAMGSITLTRLRDTHHQAKQVLLDGPELNLVIEAIVKRAKFLGYTGDLGDLYA